MQISIAGAGAGKTTAMADKIVKLRKETDESKNVFCITFTNNAASCIEQKLRGYYEVIPNNIIVSTIHSFLYREYIKPYYFLLFEKQYKHISTSTLPQEPKYKNAKIKQLEGRAILHQTVIPERAKWVVVKKSDDKKATEIKRDIIKNAFKEYCGGICIDEAQDIDLDIQLIIEALYKMGISIVLMGDPKQDLKGHKCLESLIEKYNGSVAYIGTCHRCPQKHLMLSNSIINTDEQQHSNKEGGLVSINFENDKPCSEIIIEEDFQLCYISKKQREFDTRNVKATNNIIFTLSEEIESELHRLYPDIPELTLLRESYYYAELLLEKYLSTNDKMKAMIETFKNVVLSEKAYAIIINILSNNSAINQEKVLLNSIDSIKGQEGENCLFVLTTDLAAYLFGEKTENTITKNRLYVALTRSLDRLTVFITKEVELKYKRQYIIDFFGKLMDN